MIIRFAAGRLAAVALVAAGILVAATATAAQQERVHDHARDQARTGAEREEARADAHHGYADLLDREVRALAPEEVEALLSAEGMGQALAAELNGYPGPRHVLDLADELGLTPGQWERVRAVHTRMREAALSLGARVVEAERALDRAFAEGRITPEELDTRVEEIGRLRARLRAVHLRAHLETTALLEPEQIARYQQSRGYRP